VAAKAGQSSIYSSTHQGALRFRSGRVEGGGFREPAYAVRSLHEAEALVRASAGEGRSGAYSSTWAPEAQKAAIRRPAWP